MLTFSEEMQLSIFIYKEDKMEEQERKQWAYYLAGMLEARVEVSDALWRLKQHGLTKNETYEVYKEFQNQKIDLIDKTWRKIDERIFCING